VSDATLIPAALYGLRTWRPGVDDGGECLTGAYDATPWPDAGRWLHASCACGCAHAPPDPECTCGVHAWHPDRSAARRVLGRRFDLPGIVEAAGAIQVHDEGFRAERARPYALVVTPGRNLMLARRLGRRYGAEVVEVSGPDALVAWCRERGLGLEAPVVDVLLGGERAAERQADRRRGRRRDAVGVAAVVAIAAALLGFGGAFASGPPSPHGVYGRTGWVVRPKPQGCPPPRTRPAVRTPAPRATSGTPPATGPRRRAHC
jgi:hypothetical protein